MVTFYVKCCSNQKNWKTSPTVTARIEERFLQQFIVKLFKMTTQKDILTHENCKMIYIRKGRDSLLFSTTKFHHAKLSKEETEQSDTTFKKAVNDKGACRGFSD